MSYEDSIVSIRVIGRREAQRVQRFGTAFLIHTCAEASYFLTSAHTLEGLAPPCKVSLSENPESHDLPPSEGTFAPKVHCVCIGAEANRDLAIIRTEPVDRSPLCLSLEESECDAYVLGWARDPDRGFFARRRLLAKADGPLTEAVEGGMQVRAWDIRLDREREKAILKGHSGSPMFHSERKQVIGVVTWSDQSRLEGYAIHIRELAAIWTALPTTLLSTRPPETERDEIDEIRRQSAIDEMNAATKGSAVAPPPTGQLDASAVWQEMESKLKYLDMDRIETSIRSTWPQTHCAAFLLKWNDQAFYDNCRQRLLSLMTSLATDFGCLEDTVFLDPASGVTRISLLKRLAENLGHDYGGESEDALAQLIADRIMQKTRRGNPYLVPVFNVEKLTQEDPSDLVAWFDEILMKPLAARLEDSVGRARCFFVFIAQSPDGLAKTPSISGVLQWSGASANDVDLWLGRSVDETLAQKIAARCNLNGSFKEICDEIAAQFKRAYPQRA